MSLSSVIQSHNLDIHICADKAQIYISFATPDTYHPKTSSGLKNSKLSLPGNADKIEFLIIGTTT